MTTHTLTPGDHVMIVAGRYAGKFAIVDELVGKASLWCFIMGDDTEEYALIRASSVD
jgi:hypothetical protein